MKIIRKKSNGDELKLRIDGTTASFANLLRRAASYDVPVLAIEDIYFSKNSSALYDEILAHRLGLIPLKATTKSYTLPEDCKCENKGCGSCEARGSLKAIGPCTVFAKDLIFKDKDVKIIYPEMPIVKLLAGQELELQAVAVLGKGSVHAKWSPGLVFYQRYPQIKIEKQGKLAAEGASHCPLKVFSISKDEVKIENLEACNLCRSCQDRSKGAIKVDGEENSYLFTIESWGQLEPKEILAQAIDEVKGKLKPLTLK